MKITQKNSDGKINFNLLAYGDIFCYDGCFYICCPQVYDSAENACFNAVNLENGLFHYFESDEKVKKIENTELIVEL